MKLHNIFLLHEDMDNMVFERTDDLREFANVIVLDKPEYVKYYSIHSKKWVNVGSPCISDKEDQAILNGILERHGQEAYNSISALNNAAYWASIAGKAYYWGINMLVLSLDTCDEYKDILRNNLRIFLYCCLEVVSEYSAQVDAQYYHLCTRMSQWRVDWHSSRCLVQKMLSDAESALSDVEASDIETLEKKVLAMRNKLMVYSMRQSQKESWKDQQKQIFRSGVEHARIQLAKQNQNG